MTQLTQHAYSCGTKPRRYYVDGKRVSRDDYEFTVALAEQEGRQLNSFFTKAKPYGLRINKLQEKNNKLVEALRRISEFTSYDEEASFGDPPSPEARIAQKAIESFEGKS